METIWTLIESCIITIITYWSETWDINQNQTKRLNRILVDNIIKRILNLPQPTPRECLYYELGTLDIEHRIITKRLNYATTLLIKNPDNLREIGLLQAANPKSWIQKTIQQARWVGLDLYTLRHISAKDRKILLKESITKSMNGKHNTEGQNKSKFKFLTTNSETRRSAKPSYLYKLPKEQARAIFMARTRMIKVKTNYQNMYPNTICRGCGLKEETQQHVYTRGMHFNPHTGQPKDTNQPNILQWPNNYQINSQQTNNPIKTHKRMGTSVACYHDGAWRPGAPGNTHVKRKKK